MAIQDAPDLLYEGVGLQRRTLEVSEIYYHLQALRISPISSAAKYKHPFGM